MLLRRVCCITLSVMDVSKLPRLSKTTTPGEAPTDSDAPPAVAPTPYRETFDSNLGTGPEVWLSAILGVVFVLLGRGFARWAFISLTGGTFHTGVDWRVGPLAGQEVAYWDLQGFTAFQDAALFFFGAAMILEAAVLVVVHRPVKLRRPLLWLAITITVLATTLNLLLSLRLLSIGIMPLISLLAVAFGGYIAAYEWKLLKRFAPQTTPS
jgi:hypothetical protein